MKIRSALNGLPFPIFSFFRILNSGKQIAFILATIVLINLNTASGQVYPYQNFSVREGLIHSNVYSIAQDHTGYMWFATENGLSRFDGITFENKTLIELGLTSYISSVYVDENNIIYLGTGTDGIFKYTPISGKIEKVNKTPVAPSNQIVIRDDELISLQEIRGFDFLSRKTGLANSIDTALYIINNNNKALSICKLSNNILLLGRNDGLYRFSNNRQIKLNISGLKNVSIYSIFETLDKSILVGSNNVIYKIENEKVTDSITVLIGSDSRVRNIFIDNQNNVWFNKWGTKDIYMISKNILINVSEKLGLKNVSISRVMCDRDGNIWVGTMGKGVFLFSNMFSSNFISNNEKYSSNIKKIIQTSNNKLLLGTSDGIAVLDLKTKNMWNAKHIPEISQYVRDIISIDKNNFVVAITDTRLKHSIENKFKTPFESINICYVHGSSLFFNMPELWIGNWDYTILSYNFTEPGKLNLLKSLDLGPTQNKRINCFFKDKYNRIWVGGQQNLFISKTVLSSNKIIRDIQNQEILKILDAGDNQLLIISNAGFLKIKNHTDPEKITVIQKLEIPNTTCVAMTGSDEYLVGTQNGLIVIDDDKRSILTIHDGVPAESINDIFYDDNAKIAWVGTSEGLMEIDMEKFHQFSKIVYPIDELIVMQGDSIFENQKKITLPFTKNSLSIKFKSFNYCNPSKLKYRYKIDDEAWKYSPTTELQFASFTPGDHIFRISTENEQGTNGPERILFLNIIPPFYRTVWFYILTAIGSALLLFVFIRRQLNTIRIKQEEKSATQQKLVELQQKALASNLNPHFIFNSLNSIQHFINSHNSAEANDYLSKFSRLMRMQLNMADKSFITLHEEISRLEFYLSLEQMRFGEKLTWQIIVDPNIDPYRLEIPNMIIQPFIENAIWHGIMPSDIPGNILLNIQLLAAKKLEITVTDNGVGYGQNKSSIEPGHESKGVKLITDRLILLDPHASKLLVFANNFPGTRVSIELTPKMYRFQEEN